MASLNPNNFTPSLFISIGKTGAMFTLRHTELKASRGMVLNGVFTGSYYETSYHWQNLGITADDSYDKAESIARSHGLTLTTSREWLEKELRKIERAERLTDEERAEREVTRLISGNYSTGQFADQNLMEELSRISKRRADRNLPRGSFLFGKYENKSYDEVGAADRDYMEYMSKEPTADDKYARTDAISEHNRFAIRQWLDTHEDTRVPSTYFGEIKKRYTFEVVINSVRPIESDYGFSILVKMTTTDGKNILSTFYSGDKWEPKAGENYTVKATVKKHAEFRGVLETNVNRVAVVADKGK